MPNHIAENEKTESCKLRVPYASVWDGGITIETAARVDIKTGEVTDIAPVDVTGLEICEREYIVMNDVQVGVYQDEHGFGFWADIQNEYM